MSSWVISKQGWVMVERGRALRRAFGQGRVAFAFVGASVADCLGHV
jgi:hypothetical protein